VACHKEDAHEVAKAFRDGGYPVYKKDDKQSQLHKIGHPENPKGDHPELKKKEKRR